MRKCKTHNLIIIGYVFFLIILLLPFLSYTRDITENPNKPTRNNAVREVHLREVLRFSDVPEKEIYFKRPRGIKLDDNGNIYIQDKPHILKFGPDGKFLVKLIKIGEGPGELQDLAIVNLENFFVIGNNVITISGYPYKIMWFNERGEFQKEKKLLASGSPYLFITPDLTYYTFQDRMPRRDEMPYVGSFKYSWLLSQISPDFNKQEVIHTFPMEGDVYKRDARGIQVPKYVVIDSDTLVVNTAKEYEFISLDLRSSKKLKTFTHKYKREKASTGRKFSAIWAMHYVQPEIWVVTRTVDKDNFPLICAHDLETGNVEEFFLRFPESDSRRRYGGNNIAISNGFIFTIEQSPEGFYNIVKYRIKRAKVSRAVAALKVASLLLVQNLKKDQKLY